MLRPLIHVSKLRGLDRGDEVSMVPLNVVNWEALIVVEAFHLVSEQLPFIGFRVLAKFLKVLDSNLHGDYWDCSSQSDLRDFLGEESPMIDH